MFFVKYLDILNKQVLSSIYFCETVRPNYLHVRLEIVLNLEIPMINKNHLKVALHGGGALVVEVALLCIASPSVL